MPVSGLLSFKACCGVFESLCRRLFKEVLESWEESYNPLDIPHYHIKESGLTYYAVCPGGEEAVLKTVDRKRFAGSNPVHGAMF